LLLLTLTPYPPTPPSYSSFSCSRAHRDLHSFPTRRSSDLGSRAGARARARPAPRRRRPDVRRRRGGHLARAHARRRLVLPRAPVDRKSTRLNSSHRTISYAVFCLKKKKTGLKNK